MFNEHPVALLTGLSIAMVIGAWILTSVLSLIGGTTLDLTTFLGALIMVAGALVVGVRSLL